MISPPKCGCSERSSDDQVFTCPECMGFIIRFADGERVDQHELFEYLDSTGSVSALSRSRGGLTPIKQVLEVVLDDLPF